jgi:hypothetical protein
MSRMRIGRSSLAIRARESPAHRDPQSARYFLLDPLGGPCDQFAALVLEQQNGRRIDVEDFRDARQQLIEQPVER